MIVIYIGDRDFTLVLALNLKLWKNRDIDKVLLFGCSFAYLL